MAISFYLHGILHISIFHISSRVYAYLNINHATQYLLSSSFSFCLLFPSPAFCPASYNLKTSPSGLQNHSPYTYCVVLPIYYYSHVHAVRTPSLSFPVFTLHLLFYPLILPPLFLMFVSQHQLLQLLLILFLPPRHFLLFPEFF